MVALPPAIRGDILNLRFDAIPGNPPLSIVALPAPKPPVQEQATRHCDDHARDEFSPRHRRTPVRAR
jgi:hypothetical protein